MCVEILLNSAILFKFRFIAGKCLYDKISSMFKRGNPSSGEREVKQKYLYFPTVLSYIQLTISSTVLSS